MASEEHADQDEDRRTYGLPLDRANDDGGGDDLQRLIDGRRDDEQDIQATERLEGQAIETGNDNERRRKEAWRQAPPHLRAAL